MDSRLALFGALGLEIGDAHLIRNAGGMVTDDVLRSLAISQRGLGTAEIAVHRAHRLRDVWLRRRGRSEPS